MSASLVVDLSTTTQYTPSIVVDPILSGGGPFAASGGAVGNYVDLNNANTYCNVWVTTGQSYSGQIRVAIQTSDSTPSGTFTDPTSGLVAGDFPTTVQSGGLLWINSGGGSTLSGTITLAAFQRPHRYARLILLSGVSAAPAVNAGFISQLRTTVSGTGVSFQPLSGTVIVV